MEIIDTSMDYRCCLLHQNAKFHHFFFSHSRFFFLSIFLAFRIKMFEESSSTLPPPTQPAPTSAQAKPRISPHEIRNADLVNRFLAATPPFLYSPPVGPPNFFFSEMLRSLVQAKTNEQNSRIAAHQMRRPRKRLWSQSRCMFDTPPSTLAPAIASNLNESNSQTGERNATPIEKPLELTTKMPTLFPNALMPALKSQKFDLGKMMSTTAIPSSEEKAKTSPEPSNKIARNYSPTNNVMSSEPSAASLPPSDLVLPPPPPMWYPPLYPPYGIDPLHFFIDLRVSGHIYDRKKENISPTSSSTATDNNNTSIATNFEAPNQLGKYRIGSAFSVPARRDKSPLALNLTSPTMSSHDRPANDNLVEYMNNNIDSDGKQLLAKNTNYVLQNLPRIYTTLTAHGGSDDRQSTASSDTELPDYEAKDNERSSEHSDDVVIVDHDSDAFDRKYNTKRSHKI